MTEHPPFLKDSLSEKERNHSELVKKLLAHNKANLLYHQFPLRASENSPISLREVLFAYPLLWWYNFNYNLYLLVGGA